MKNLLKYCKKTPLGHLLAAAITTIGWTIFGELVSKPIAQNVKISWTSNIIYLIKSSTLHDLLNSKGITSVNTVPQVGLSIISFLFAAIILYFLVSAYTSYKCKKQLQRCEKSCQMNAENCKKLQEITESSDAIDGAVIYRYRTHLNKTEGIVEVEHVCSFAEEQVCLNAIIRELFIFPKQLYLDIQHFSRLYNEHLGGHGNLAGVKAEGRRIIEAVKPLLLAKTPDNITENDCCLYQVYRMLWLVVNDVKSARYVLDDSVQHNLENALLESKRTGIISSIFLNDIQTFQNTKRFKNNRVYIAFRGEIVKNGKSLVFLIAADGQALGAEKDVEEIANVVKEKFTSDSSKKLDNNIAYGA